MWTDTRFFYPETLKIPNKFLTQIYSSHRYHNLRPGFPSITFKDNHVVSFFSRVGTDFINIENYIVALLLRSDEKPGKNREILKSFAAEILEWIPDNSFNNYFDKDPPAFMIWIIFLLSLIDKGKR